MLLVNCTTNAKENDTNQMFANLMIMECHQRIKGHIARAWKAREKDNPRGPNT